ncbi:MAG: hypothetical protein ISS15_08695 [Alphaproteobacteria bacterium]|nr:hypothetical protein [Alphaproteobacteria bacterium]MBL6936952.1 hypothetical protein [Alphaproteobacteria bacterium]MBL7097721.1 hypothetical protein [Alphaproteobacteria bacterium]
MAVADVAMGRFDIGRVTTRTFDVIKANFVSFFLLGLIATIPTSVYRVIIQFASTANNPLAGNGQTGVYVLTAFGSAILGMFLALVLQATLTYGTIAYLNGQPVALGRAIGIGLRQFFPLLGIAIVEGIAIGLGFLLFIVPGFMLYTMWAVAVPVRVAEQEGVFASLTRSSDLTHGYRWPVFGTLAVFYLGSAIAQGLAGPVMTAGALSSGSAATAYVGMILTALIGAVVATASATLVASIYYELRMIKEGVGPAQIASVFD